ncbi:MAG TPA: NUDIX domain-containing protein [Xanthobacteraceae bacterium]|jgi:8-oxo-dGTP pyrophosphatase MutT (NUDIX family)|nr:NUDIX domain-containing protein [Xanthobacteraceae bacterium]
MTDYFLTGDRNLTPSDAAVALITLDDGRYLMQLRSQKPGIFYPGHWGLFGGAVDLGEDCDAALVRELKEELGSDIEDARYFTEFTFDFSYRGLGVVARRYYTVLLATSRLSDLVLGEGAAMKAFAAHDLLTTERVVPYDAFAIWLHATAPH